MSSCVRRTGGVALQAETFGAPHHTHLHACTHTHVHAHTRARTHTCTHTHVHAHLRARIPTCVHTCMQVHLTCAIRWVGSSWRAPKVSSSWHPAPCTLHTWRAPKGEQQLGYRAQLELALAPCALYPVPCALHTWQVSSSWATGRSSSCAPRRSARLSTCLGEVARAPPMTNP